MTIVKAIVLAVFALLVSGVVRSQSVDAYSVEVAVADRSVEEQQAAYSVAMRKVLLANSGDKTLLNRNDVRAGLRGAEAFVESFGYRVPQPGTVVSKTMPITDTVRRTGEATQFMLIRFDRQRIRQLIDVKKDLIKSDDAAPAIDPFTNVSAALVWLLVQDGRADTLVGGSTGNKVMLRAREIAGGAGLSLNFPAADDVDMAALTADDIRSGNLQRVQAAAERYAQSVMLVAYLSRQRLGGWSGQWLKVAGDQVQNTTIDSANLDSAVQQGLAWLKPAITVDEGTVGAARPQYRYGGGGNGTEALIWVSSLNSTSSYAEVMRFLSDLDAVQRVYPKEVSENGVIFAVLPRTAATAVGRAAESISWLRASAPPVAASASSLGRDIEFALDYLR